MSHLNDKGMVQEKVAKFKGTGSVDFTTNQSGGAVLFSSTLTVDLQYNGAKKQLTTQSDGFFHAKKMAEQSAASRMLALDDFTFYTNHLNWNSHPASPQCSTPTSSVGYQTYSNPKGSLLERIAKMARRPQIDFNTTPAAPFTCTVIVQPVESSEPIVVSSDQCSSKKEAEQQASERMLNDARFGNIGRRGEVVQPSSPATTNEASSSTAVVAGGSTSTGSANFKGKLLERMAQSGGGVKFDCASCPGGFTSVAVAHHIKSTTPFESRSDAVYSSKIEADQSAARMMLYDPAFASWLRGVAPGSSHVAPVAVVQARSRSPSDVSDLSTMSSFSTLTQSVTAPHLNAKGMLLERSVKMLPQPRLDYQITASAPFVCTLTAQILSSGANNVGTIITMTSVPCAKKKDAEQDAAAKMLAHSQFQSMGHVTTVTASDPSVRCAKCKGLIGDINDFCFYVKSDTEVQFIVKPEVAKQIIAKSPPIPGAGPLPEITFASNYAEAVKSSQAVGVMCGHCRSSVGAHVSFGPEGAFLTAFRNTDVTVKGAQFPSSRAWKLVSTEEAFCEVEQRTPRNFYGVEDVSNIRPVLDLTHVVHPKLVEGLGADSPDFQYSDLLDPECTKHPREQQTTALHLALQHHAVVVFPTGFGKTLVASMVMCRYRRLNPAKLVLMVEERVPLVEQQCKAISKDTGLKICAMYGENSSSRAVSQLLQGEYDGAVITAGALCNYLSQDLLRVSDFSVMVFDESHHATKAHQYKLILDMVARFPEYLQPRVLGLTASPLKGKTEESAYGELQMMRETFLDAVVYRPPISTDIHDLLRHTVVLSPQQSDMQRKLVSELQPLVLKLTRYFAENRPNTYAQLIGENPIQLTVNSNKYDWMRVTQLSAESYFTVGRDPQAIIDLADSMRQRVAALEQNYLLGPSFVTLYGGSVQDTIAADAAPEPHHLKSGVSPQLHGMCEILTEKGADSCTLVFVETRYVAQVVTDYIDAKYPQLKCERLVGQSGDDGMRWGGEGGQRKILEAFRTKKCRLIVCTSVLEEGTHIQVLRPQCTRN